jgi:putative copper export protein
MITFIVMAIYIVGVYMAYFQIQKWTGHKITEDDEYQTLFLFSLFSWLVYPIYGLIWVIKKDEED